MCYQVEEVWDGLLRPISLWPSIFSKSLRTFFLLPFIDSFLGLKPKLIVALFLCRAYSSCVVALFLSNLFVFFYLPQFLDLNDFLTAVKPGLVFIPSFLSVVMSIDINYALGCPNRMV